MRSFAAAIFDIFSARKEPVEAAGVCYRGTVPQDKIRPRFDLPLSAIRRRFK
jgi:hypothetical protein